MSGGASFGHYRVVRQLGEGGMGVVYLGQHELIGRHAAIKVLLPEVSAQRRNVDRFFQEARATSMVTDPGIVQIYDFGFTADKSAYIVMEYLDGESLGVRLRRLITLTPAEALRITRQAAGSLAAAHSAGIVHRDLKPDNLFLIRDPEAPGGERAKILDFGIAKLGDDDPENRVITRAGQVIGTPVYMSPEQAGGKPIDFRADIYSLGCVLFHMLTGRPPFDVSGMYAVISAHLRDRPPTITEVAPHLPGELDVLVGRCLRKSPGDRYASMLELQLACDELVAAAPAELAIRRSLPYQMPTISVQPHTTLGHSTGEPLSTTEPGKWARSTLSGKRLSYWLGASAIAVAIGIGVALVTARGGSKLPAPVAPEAAPTVISLPRAAPAPTAAPPTPPPATVAPSAAAPALAPVATSNATPSDASVDTVPRPSRPSRPSRPLQSTKHVTNATPNADDLYGDRN